MRILVIFLVVSITICGFHIDLCLMDRPFVTV